MKEEKKRKWIEIRKIEKNREREKKKKISSDEIK